LINDFVDDQAFFTMLITAMFCGALVGLERQIRGKPAGMRTSMLICVGTATFIHLGASLSAPGLDPARVLGQVVTGIGFLGAGVMFTREGMVLGVTTASVIWILAAIGAAIGLGLYNMGMALAAATLFILVCTEWLEKTFIRFRRGAHELYNSKPPKD